MDLRTHHPDDDAYERDEGVLVRRGGGRDVGCDDQEWCAPDDLVEDPVNDEHVPGTMDDLPYDYGVETPVATDQQLLTIDQGFFSGFGDLGVTETGEPDDDEPSPLGAADERELWHHQRALIDEAGDEERRYRGLTAAEVPAVEDAVGDEAGEVLPESPGGTSATGSTG